MRRDIPPPNPLPEWWWYFYGLCGFLFEYDDEELDRIFPD